MTDIPDHRSQWDAYGELWVIGDAAARGEACDGVLATGCTYTDPSVHAEGVCEIAGKDVCRVDVAASAKPVFACPLNSKQATDFWVRQGNQTSQFHGTDLTDYQEAHWG